jgi:hypothetical protein
MTPLEQFLFNLEEKAKAATQEEWYPCNGDGYSINRVLAKNTIAHVLGDTAEAEANMNFIAAANPVEVQKLIAMVREMRGALDNVDQVLRVPAAEYVPAISDAFTVIDKTLARLNEMEGK